MMTKAGLVVKLVMVLLLLFSVISWAIILTKWYMFRRARKASAAFLDSFWDSATLNDAYDVAREFPLSPEATVFVTGYHELKKIGAAHSAPQSACPELVSQGSRVLFACSLPSVNALALACPLRQDCSQS